MKGHVKSFSGNPLAHVTVDYNIKKEDLRRQYFRNGSNAVRDAIIGNTKADGKGNFTIKISLKKDENIADIQVDRYNIDAFVTDVNGEKVQDLGWHRYLITS